MFKLNCMWKHKVWTQITYGNIQKNMWEHTVCLQITFWNIQKNVGTYSMSSITYENIQYASIACGTIQFGFNNMQYSVNRRERERERARERESCRRNFLRNVDKVFVM